MDIPAPEMSRAIAKDTLCTPCMCVSVDVCVHMHMLCTRVCVCVCVCVSVWLCCVYNLVCLCGILSL